MKIHMRGGGLLSLTLSSLTYKVAADLSETRRTVLSVVLDLFLQIALYFHAHLLP